MSFDLAVFEPRGELRNRSLFMSWYTDVTSWKTGVDYSDASIASPSLQRWYRDITKIFPPISKQLGESVEPCLSLAEYASVAELIYAAFRWESAAVAYESAQRLAGEHELGFFALSGEKGEVWFPTQNKKLELVHQKNPGTLETPPFLENVPLARTRANSSSLNELIQQIHAIDPTHSFIKKK